MRFVIFSQEIRVLRRNIEIKAENKKKGESSRNKRLTEEKRTKTIHGTLVEIRAFIRRTILRTYIATARFQTST